jgi:hypothetical protein
VPLQIVTPAAAVASASPQVTASIAANPSHTDAPRTDMLARIAGSERATR